MIKDGEDKHGLKTFQDAKSLKTRTRFIIDIWFSNKGSTENCMLVKRRQNTCLTLFQKEEKMNYFYRRSMPRHRSPSKNSLYTCTF